MKQISRDDVVEMAAQTQCANCKIPYGRRGVHVLGRRGTAWMIAVTCPRCEAEGLMIATVDEDDGSIISIDQETDTRPQIMYDVTYDEWLTFQKRPPISRDDVLDMHVFLQEFDGDFAGWFARKIDSEENVK